MIVKASLAVSPPLHSYFPLDSVAHCESEEHMKRHSELSTPGFGLAQIVLRPNCFWQLSSDWENKCT